MDNGFSKTEEMYVDVGPGTARVTAFCERCRCWALHYAVRRGILPVHVTVMRVDWVGLRWS